MPVTACQLSQPAVSTVPSVGGFEERRVKQPCIVPQP